MSSDDDPFGSGGKTVIRPRPGGAPRPDPSVRAQPLPGSAPAYSLPPQSMPRPAAGGGPRPAGRPPSWPADPPARYGLGSEEDDWTGAASRAQQAFFPSNEAAAAPSEPVRKIPLEAALNARDGGAYSAANPITAAAAPLLILLGRLRLMVVEMHAKPLMAHVSHAIREFERRVLDAGVPKEDAIVAKYALCGTADDIVQNLPGTDRHVWTQFSMLAQFFQVRTSGIGFFEELNKILANPAPRYDLLELMHACLSLGFEGQYRTAGGDRELQRVRSNVYETLRRVRPRSDDDISPRWQGVSKALGRTSATIPLFAIAGGAAALLVGVYLLLRFLISSEGDALAEKLLALNSAEPVEIERALFTPYSGPDLADTTQLERIRAALSDEIAAGGLGVEAKGESIVVEISNLLLFDSGSAEVKDAFKPVAQRIAIALDPEPGTIGVTGHTDNVKPKKSSAFKSNYDLSVARAEAVKAILASLVKDPGRIVAQGKGDDEPIGNNKTAEGRAKNRRVDLMIPREGTP